MKMGQNPKTLTSANSTLMIKFAGVYDSFFQVEGFQADNAWSFGDRAIAETRMGVDGKQSAGFTPHEVDWSIYLEGNSPSVQRFENTYSWYLSKMEIAPVEIILTIPSLGTKYYGSGFMVSASGGPNGKKILDGTVYNFKMIANGREEL